MILFTARHFHRETLKALKDAGVNFEVKDRVSRLYIMSLCYDDHVLCVRMDGLL